MTTINRTLAVEVDALRQGGSEDQIRADRIQFDEFGRCHFCEELRGGNRSHRCWELSLADLARTLPYSKSDLEQVRDRIQHAIDKAPHFTPEPGERDRLIRQAVDFAMSHNISLPATTDTVIDMIKYATKPSDLPQVVGAPVKFRTSADESPGPLNSAIHLAELEMIRVQVQAGVDTLAAELGMKGDEYNPSLKDSTAASERKAGAWLALRDLLVEKLIPMIEGWKKNEPRSRAAEIILNGE